MKHNTTRDPSIPELRPSGRERLGFISDLHLSPSQPDIEARLAEALSGWVARLDRLFILGDLFEFWIGDDAARECGQLGIEERLAELARRGVGLAVMHGNRDFLLGADFCERIGSDLLADPCVLRYGRCAILLSHGDGYCTDDLEHQETRRLLRSAAWRREFLSRPVRERLDFAVEARGISESGKRAKPARLMDVNRAAIRDAMLRRECRLMIHGHTHLPAVHRFDLAGRPALRVVLSDWFDRPGRVTLAPQALQVSLPDGARHEFDPDEFR